MHALSLIPLCVLLLALNHQLFLLRDPADAAKLGAQLATANKGVITALTLGLAVVILQLAWGILKSGLEAYRKRVAA